MLSGTFSGALTITGSLVACISPTAVLGLDAAVTLVSTDSRFQYATLTAARIYKLPSTNIRAGETFTFVNRATNDSYRMNLQASADSGTTYIDWIVNGKITVMALQDTPTTAAHWATIDAVSDVVLYTPITGGFGTISSNESSYKRVGGSVDLKIKFAAGTVSSSTASVDLPIGLTVGTISSTNYVMLGVFIRGVGSTSIKNGCVTTLSGIPNVRFSRFDTTDSTNPFSPMNGDAVLIISELISFSVTVPVAEWAMFN